MKALFVTVLVVLALAICASAEVHVATKTNFKKATSGELTLVKFYAPWCGHCKQLAPEFEKAANMVGDKAKLVEVDCTKEAKLCQKYKVEGYPTLIVFRNGEESEKYSGPRDAKGIAQYLKGQTGPAVQPISTEEELKELINDSTACVFKTSSAKSRLSKAMLKIANTMRTSMTFAMITDESIAPSMDMEAVVVYRNGESETYTGKPKSKAITAFIKSARIPYLGEITPESFSMYAELKDTPVGWVFISAEGGTELKETLLPVAKKSRSDIIMCWVDADKFGMLAQQMALGKQPTYPAFVIDIDRKHHIHPLDVDITASSVTEFIQKFKRGDVKPTLMSDPVPDPETSKGLTTLVGNTFAKYIAKGEDMFIFFYAPWCGHCKKLHPIVKKLAKSFESADVVIAQLDATANDFDRDTFSVQGFPTIFFVPAGGLPVLYEGDRSLENLTSFVQEHATTNVEPKEVPEGEADDDDDDDDDDDEDL